MHPSEAANGAEAILEFLKRQETDYIFCSPIAAWAPLWEALAKRKERGEADRPRYINCRHETLAVGLASGYFKATGRAQVVLLPTGLGVLNGSMALRTAHQEHTSMVVLSIDTLTYGEVPNLDPGPEWPAVLVDLPGPAHDGAHCVSWACEVKTPGDLHSQMRRAFYFAESVPRGPTLLQVPFDIIMSPAPITPLAKLQPSPSVASANTLRKAADLLCHAENPVIITEYAGRAPESMDALISLAEVLAAPVFEWWMPAYQNFPRHHPLCGRGGVETVLPEADCVLVVECSAPWHPPQTQLNSNVKVIALGEEPLRPRAPYYGYRTDHAVAGDVTLNLQHLLVAVTSRTKPREDRFQKWKGHNQKKRAEERQRDRLASEQTKHAVHASLLFQALNEALPENSVIVDEMVAQVPAMLQYLFEGQPLEHIRGWHGGLGTGLSTALGVKLARPNHLVVSLIGDGAFNYNPVPACFGLTQQYGLPLLIVICNNQGFVSQTWNIHKYFPEGAAVRNRDYYGKVIEPTPDYWKLAAAWGGHGERVSRPDELGPAIRRCLEAIGQRRFALLDVIVEP